MKHKLIVVFVMLLSVFAGYQALFAFLPNIIYNRFYTGALDEPNRQENQFFMLLNPDENARAVVKPNPDFSYGCAFYNLNDGPLDITGTIPDSTYWSIAFYSPNTINYFVKNDTEFDSKNFKLILGNGTCSETTIKSPTNKGFILIRYLSKNKSIKELEQAKKHLTGLRIEQYTCVN